jgi:hypothetical protein
LKSVLTHLMPMVLMHVERADPFDTHGTVLEKRANPFDIFFLF